jgi:hypothetical protein
MRPLTKSDALFCLSGCVAAGQLFGPVLRRCAMLKLALEVHVSRGPQSWRIRPLADGGAVHTGHGGVRPGRLGGGEDGPEAERLIAGAGDDGLPVRRYRKVQHAQRMACSCGLQGKKGPSAK